MERYSTNAIVFLCKFIALEMKEFSPVGSVEIDGVVNLLRCVEETYYRR